MRIDELRLIRYGKFTDRTLELPAGPQDIHLIVGANEAGKSTLRTAIGDWLFGIPARTPLNFLHPMPELRLGGTLERPGEHGATDRLSFDRTKGNKNTVRTPQDAVLADEVLLPWRGALQAETFNRAYALDHETLARGGQSILEASDDVGRLLFQSAAGIEHLGEVLQSLEREADELWAPRKSASRAFYVAREAYDRAVDDGKQATLRSRDWKAQQEALTQTREALAVARNQALEVRKHLNRLQRIRRTLPLLRALGDAQARHDELLHEGDAPLLPEDAAQTLFQAQRNLAVIAADLQRLAQEHAQARAEGDGIHTDPDVLALADDITELNERRLQFRQHRADLVKRQDEVQALWRQVRDLATELGWGAQDEDSVRARLPSTPARLQLARLLKTQATTTLELTEARRTLAEHQRQIRKLEHERQQLEAKTLPEGLEAALQRAHRLGDPETALAQAQREHDTLTDQLEAALSALGTWRVEPEALANLLVPDPAHLQGLLTLQGTDRTALASLDQDITDKTSHIARLNLDLQQLVSAHQPVSRHELEQVRQERDGLWQTLKANPEQLPALASPFELHIKAADDLADRRLDRAQYEAERQAQTQGLEQQQLELASLNARREATLARLHERQAEWQVLSKACGLPGLPLDLAPGWLEQRRKVLDTVQACAAAERQLTALRQAVEQHRQALWSLLADTSAPAPSLTSCMRQAQALLQQSDQTLGQRRSLDTQLNRLSDDLPGLQARIQEAQAASDAWASAWSAATSAAGYAGTAAPEQVEAELGVIERMGRQLDEMRQIRSERIATMQADLDGLAATAQVLADRLDPPLATQPPEAIALALHERLAAAQQARAQARQAQQRLQKVQAGQATAQSQQHSTDALLAPLMSAAGAHTVDDLARCIARSDQRRGLEHQILQARQNLNQAGDGLTEAELRAEAQGIEPDALMAEIDALQEEATEIERKLSELGTLHGSQQSAFDAQADAEGAAGAEARRQQAITDMVDAAENYLRLKNAALLLKWSIDRFRETQQGPLLERASALFQTLTQGSFKQLVADTQETKPQLLGIRPTGQVVVVDGMSEGTRDQLYLALRLAALELQSGSGVNPPFIADDLFVNFDDGRTRAGLQVLGGLSEHLQVIVLTHHRHLVPLARDVLGERLNVVEL